MRQIHAVVLAAGLAAAAPALAQQGATVEGVKMPAWVERGGSREPLAPGMRLKGGDAVRTGGGSRVLLKLPEGSSVKLGEGATLRIQQARPESGVFRAVLDVVEGAFRFTTGLLSKPRKREVSITVGTVVAGVRGTDLWGKSEAQRQVVCLIEGKVEVGAQGEAPVAMDQPRQFYRREGGVTQPVGFVSPEQLADWSRQTEIAPDSGAARRGGKWRVTLASPESEAQARALRARLRADGYAAEIRAGSAAGKRVHHVLIGQLASRADAEALAAQLRGHDGVGEPAVSD